MVTAIRQGLAMPAPPSAASVSWRAEGKVRHLLWCCPMDMSQEILPNGHRRRPPLQYQPARPDGGWSAWQRQERFTRPWLLSLAVNR